MYGTQTISQSMYVNIVFENDVKMYGTQTHIDVFPQGRGLRMM